MRMILIALILGSGFSYATPPLSPVEIRLQRIEALILEQHTAWDRETSETVGYGRCNDSCDTSFPWNSDPKAKEPEDYQRQRAQCYQHCKHQYPIAAAKYPGC